MTRKTRTEIEIEKDEVVIIKRSVEPVAWCTGCGESTRMARPDEAALMAGLSLREINRFVEAGGVHFVETPEGMLLICIDSLLALHRRQL